MYKERNATELESLRLLRFYLPRKTSVPPHFVLGTSLHWTRVGYETRRVTVGTVQPELTRGLGLFRCRCVSSYLRFEIRRTDLFS